MQNIILPLLLCLSFSCLADQNILNFTVDVEGDQTNFSVKAEPDTAFLLDSSFSEEKETPEKAGIESSGCGDSDLSYDNKLRKPHSDWWGYAASLIE